MPITTDPIQTLDSKASVNQFDGNKKQALTGVVKKCHVLDGKYFIVFGKVITDQLDFFKNIKDEDLYFQQEITEDSCILLRPLKLSETG